MCWYTLVILKHKLIVLIILLLMGRNSAKIITKNTDTTVTNRESDIAPAATAKWQLTATPRFLSRSHAYRLISGDTVVLPCEVHNLGSYVIVWRKGSALLSAGSTMVTLDGRLKLLGNSLQIKDVVSSDAGEYVCQIGDGTPGDQIHTIEILVPPQVTMLPISGHVTGRQGGTVTFECQATGNPVPRIEWTKQNGVLPTGEMSVSGTMLSIARLDRHNSGTYQCEANNGVGAPAVATVALHVLYPPEVATDRVWVIAPSGAEARLSCTVHADPKAEVQWFQDSFHLDSTDRRSMESHDDRHVLTIRRVQATDFGNYSCHVKNSLGGNKGYVQLTGKPSPARIVSVTQHSCVPGAHNITWHIDSLPPLQEIRVLIRKMMVNDTHQQGKWHDIILTPSSTERLNHIMSYCMRDLEPSSGYELMIQAKNKYGWSELSDMHHFFTRDMTNAVPNIEDMELTSNKTDRVFMSLYVLFINVILCVINFVI